MHHVEILLSGNYSVYSDYNRIEFSLKSMRSALLKPENESVKDTDMCDCTDLTAGELSYWGCYLSGVKEVPE